MRYSKQREIIYQVIKNSCEHLTPEMIYNEVRKTISNISLGTVYRNLNRLSEEGVIRKIKIANERERFDKTVSEHCHLYCEKCHKLYDIKKNVLDDIINITESKTKFTITSIDIVFNGICHVCKEKEN